jgi:hypothetical protein
LELNLGAAIMSIQNASQLTNGAVPNVNVGNNRVGGTGVLQYGFNPIFLDAALGYTFDRGPLYKQPFPIRVWGEYLNNPAAPSSADNYGWDAGVTFGKAGKKGLGNSPTCIAFTAPTRGTRRLWARTMELITPHHGRIPARERPMPLRTIARVPTRAAISSEPRTRPTTL